MPIENMTEIETSFGLAEGTLQEAIASDDAIKIEIPLGKFYETDKHEIFTKEDYQRRTENLKEENKQIGIEIAVKTARTDLGLEFEGKTIENLLKASNAKALSDANIEPDKKIQEQAGDIEKLQGTNKTLQQTIDDLNTSSTLKDNKRKIEGNILDSMEGELTLSKARIMTIFLTEHDVSEEDGKLLIKKGGETLKNETTRDPLTLKDVMPKFLEEFVKKVDGGTGAGDTTGTGGEGTLESFVNEMATAGHAQNSEHFNEEMSKRIGSGTLKV